MKPIFPISFNVNATERGFRAEHLLGSKSFSTIFLYKETFERLFTDVGAIQRLHRTQMMIEGYKVQKQDKNGFYRYR